MTSTVACKALPHLKDLHLIRFLLQQPYFQRKLHLQVLKLSFPLTISWRERTRERGLSKNEKFANFILSSPSNLIASKTLKGLFIYSLLYVYECFPMCAFMHPVFACLVPEEVRERHKIPWHGIYRC